MPNSAAETMTQTKKESLNYQSIVKEAIASLKERNGSSPQAIAKYLESSTEHKGKLPENFRSERPKVLLSGMASVSTAYHHIS